MNALRNFSLVSGLSLLLLNGCGGGSGGSSDGDNGDGNEQTSEYLNALPSWREFAPKELPEEQEGTEVVDESEMPLVQTLIDENNITKECTTEKVSFFDTPEEYVMFSPPTNILYPGAMVQGRSLRDGASAGEILPLNISQRTEVNVSIPDCKIENNFRTVLPTQSNVSSAVSSILAEADSLGADCVSPTGTLKVETYRNEQQRALRAGFSGRYFGFSGSVSGSYNKTETQNSVAAVFRESLYTVQIEAPQTPDGWFSDEFTDELLQQQIDLDRIAADNLPAYVATVTYGRMLTATMTSSYSEADMRAAMEFKYQNPAASVSGDAAARSQTIREASSMTLAYMGGDADATAAMLQSSDWTSYFGEPVTADDAVPISFEIRSVSDNSPAVTQELTSYDRVNCIEKVADDASFVFQAVQEFTPGFTGTGQAVAVGDFNGDNAADIVWANSNTEGRGEYAVALANGDGSFAPLIEMNYSAMNGLGGDFVLRVADVDRDGRDDIVFNLIKPTAENDDSNLVFVAFYKDDPQEGFIHSAGEYIHNSLTSGSGWQTYTLHIGQMDAQYGEDLVWNNRGNSGSVNRTWIAHAVDTTVEGFDLTTDPLFELNSYDDQSGDFTGYEYTHIADLDGDGHDDVILHNIGAGSMIMYVGYGNDEGIEMPMKSRNFGSTWTTYSAYVGDNNGDGYDDIIEPRQRSPFGEFAVYFEQGSSSRNNLVNVHTIQYYNNDDALNIQPLIEDVSGKNVNPDMALADINGDGGSDLIINEKGFINPLVNNIGVGLSIVGASDFTFTRAVQEHPAQIDWSQYKLYTADITADKRDDVLWISNAATNKVYVGVARTE